MRVPIQGQTMSLDEPMRWLEESGLVSVDAALREADSDRRRIEAVLDGFPEGSPAGAILEGYHQHLMRRVEAGKTSLRSIRLSLSPAASLLAFADDMKRMPPDQKALDGFLRQAPGQRAARWPASSATSATATAPRRSCRSATRARRGAGAAASWKRRCWR